MDFFFHVSNFIMQLTEKNIRTGDETVFLNIPDEKTRPQKLRTGVEDHWAISAFMASRAASSASAASSSCAC